MQALTDCLEAPLASSSKRHTDNECVVAHTALVYTVFDKRLLRIGITQTDIQVLYACKRLTAVVGVINIQHENNLIPAGRHFIQANGDIFVIALRIAVKVIAVMHDTIGIINLFAKVYKIRCRIARSNYDGRVYVHI